MDDLFEQVRPVLPFSLPDLPGYRASWNEIWHGFDIVIPEGTLFYSEAFFNQKWSDRAVEYFQENSLVDWRSADWRELSLGGLDEIDFHNIKWRQDYIKMYGKQIPLPRLTSWYGDVGKSYQYSGIKSDPNPWNDGLYRIKERIEECANHTFNCVLLNWYRDGSDSLNWHADDERELGPNPIIASANFGATRDFIIRKNDDHAQKVSLPLKHGTLLVMKGSMQHFWQHSVPKRTNVNASRFNLTFRNIN